MSVYTVHEPPSPDADRIERAASLLFIRDGFSWAAAIFGPLWMLAKGLWLVTLAYLVGTVLIGLALSFAGVAPGWGGLIASGINVLIGFEAVSLQRWTLERRGWQMIGTVTGRTRAECERRFFESWLPGEPAVRPSIEAARALRNSVSGLPLSRLSEGAGA